jgi:WS/DGAT/MGAT family acyltransferase
MAPADAAWLRMDRPTNLMIVTSVMWFDEVLDWAALRRLIQHRMVDRFPRFRQRIVEADGDLFWEDVNGFDLGEHLHPARLPEPAGRVELEEFTGGLVSVPLSRDRPLWDLYLVENYGAGCAVVFRMHHAIADGIALARLLMSLTDDPEVDPVAVVPTTAVGSISRGLAGDAAHDLLGALVHPQRLASLVTRPGRVLDPARTTVADATALAQLTLMPSDRRTALRGTAGVRKDVTWSPPIPLDLLRDAGHRTRTTVNDLLLAAVAGALRDHLVRRHSPVHDVRAIVPFNLRPLDQPLPAELGNKFGLVYVPLPLTIADRRDRLREMARRTRRVKESAQGPVAYGVLELVGSTPQAVENLAIDVFASKGTGVMTNVPGPRRPVTLAGTRLTGTIGWGPTSGELGLGVAMFSYANQVTIGLCVDAGVIPDVRLLLDDLLTELDGLVAPAVAAARSTLEGGPTRT